jgi:glycosyltransferase involved in cell wall biosynthesis
MPPENEVATSKPLGNIAAARVAILMCTKNGATFIDDQLKSIADQTHDNWSLIVSDDGSDDGTLAKLNGFATAHPQKITIRQGPQKGVCANFLSLANDPTIRADYFAFSDQDDVWEPDKLQRALDWLASVPADVPAMYCGRTEVMPSKEQGRSPLFSRPPSFENALVQSLAGGNTMVFNGAAKRILEQAATTAVVLHDWWVYQLVSAAGGVVHYDPQPMLKYRQHSDNVIGSDEGWRGRIVRLRPILAGRFRDWNDANTTALEKLPAHLITPANREILQLFMKARRAPLLQRLYFLKKSGIYRQTLFGNFALSVAAILKKI